MNGIMNENGLRLGTCYYPEHWSKSLWKEDLMRMLSVGIETVRIAEFAWSKVERREGEFDYSFFDEFLDVAEDVGMQVIFSTPTATPPAWLTEKYPEVLNADKDGTLYKHGMRRQYNYNSPKYQELSARIVDKLASHYAKRPCIIGWQIDNELNCEKDVFYSESDTIAFRKFLAEKYSDIEALNDAWGTVFWNQTYNSFDEIYVPGKTFSGSINPHEELDYKRFVSHSARCFAKMQSDIIRKYIKEGDVITTNGLFGNLDNHTMTEESLDFMMYDAYPNYAYCLDAYDSTPGSMKDRKWSRKLAEMRSISPVFGVIEQQSGANGWTCRIESPTPRPGQITLWTMQSIAHGSDFVSYFRWRTCNVGTEIYWHGILDYSGRDNRRLKEVASVHEKLEKLGEIAGALYEARVAIVKDYDNVWDSEYDVWHGRVEEASTNGLFDALERSHTPFDYVYLREGTTLDALKKYDALFYPHATIISAERARLLEEYVKGGGKIVFGCRSGYKDMSGRCVLDKLPGLLQNLTGADVLEYSFIPPDDEVIEVEWNGRKFTAAVFVDELEAIGSGNVEAKFKGGSFDGCGAIVKNKFGDGVAYYYGSAFNEECASAFICELGIRSPYKDIIAADSCCEIAVRAKGDTKYMFVLNYSKDSAKINLKKSVVDMLHGGQIEGEVELKAYQALVYRI